MNDSVEAFLVSEAPIIKMAASESERYVFSRAIGVNGDSPLLALYAVMDGYSEYDTRNDVRLWPKAEILEAFNSREFSDNDKLLAFSDFMLNDQVFLYNVDSGYVYAAFGNGSDPITFTDLIEVLRKGALPKIV